MYFQAGTSKEGNEVTEQERLEREIYVLGDIIGPRLMAVWANLDQCRARPNSQPLHPRLVRRDRWPAATMAHVGGVGRGNH
jgi:hypothetical protein